MTSIPSSSARPAADLVAYALDLLRPDTLNDFLPTMARFALRRTGAVGCGFWWLNKKDDEFAYYLFHAEEEAPLAAKVRHISFPRSTARDLSLLAPETVVHLPPEILHHLFARELPPASSVCISYDDHVPGLMFFFWGSTEPAADGVLIDLAHHSANACRKLDHLTKRRRLEEFAQETINATYEDALWDEVTRKCPILLDCDRVAIRRINLLTGQLDRLISYPKIPRSPDANLAQGVTGMVLRSGTPLRIPDVTVAPWPQHFSELWPGTRSELAAPIILPNARVIVGTLPTHAPRPFGVLNFESPAVGAFSFFDEHCVQAIAHHVASILDRLDLEDKTEKLARIERDIARQRDWEPIVNLMIAGIHSVLGFDYINLYTINSDTQKIESIRVSGVDNSDSLQSEAQWDLTGTSIQAEIVRSKRTEVPALHDPRLDQPVRKKYGLDRFISVFVPLLAPSRDDVFGLLCAGYDKAFRQHIYERDIQLLRAFADFAVGALVLTRRGLVDRLTHEINAPLSAIRNNLSYLRRQYRLLTEQHRDQILEDMETDSEILSFHVQQLEYTWGGGSSGPRKQPLVIDSVALFSEVIQKTVNQLKGMVRDHKLDPTKVSVHPGPLQRVKVAVDKRRISQVVFNLFVNAIKYAKSPDTFEIVISGEERPDAYVIKFQDRGIGIPDNLRDRIFEEGVRAPFLEGKIAGSGLGLTIARQIMREHGGDLVLKPQNSPTEFQMIIPKNRSEAS
jgi:signal transduction histidine kinase